jgi:hypothetical protein
VYEPISDLITVNDWEHEIEFIREYRSDRDFMTSSEYMISPEIYAPRGAILTASHRDKYDKIKIIDNEYEKFCKFIEHIKTQNKGGVSEYHFILDYMYKRVCVPGRADTPFDLILAGYHERISKRNSMPGGQPLMRESFTGPHRPTKKPKEEEQKPKQEQQFFYGGHR